ncbi:hypothetical protein B5E84_19195 [Lachnoclostridium sp. An14]|uniref:LrgB family protein n=1 Tax=Lachnoclostridium sp. An14 TaxID=1965562 RepID=UPI000B39FF4D|nr:LrgB family protein [Lachnoclostridium sp. An14]OUQ12214.1 hypothetical protein B5E84_19195 [Lachnoclostridium sp. An14]
MREALASSAYFGAVLSIAAYSFGLWLKKKTGFALCNPLLVAAAVIIPVLLAADLSYDEYMKGAQCISYLLTPATVCLAIPLYKQLALLKRNKAAVVCGIAAGVVANAATILVLCLLFKLEHVHYVTLLPKSITTAIGMGVSEEAGGIVTLTVVSIIITGVSGVILAEKLFQFLHLEEPVAKGLALGNAAHAIGTSKALELGEIEGAMSSLAIAVAGLMTVVVVPLIGNLI